MEGCNVYQSEFSIQQCRRHEGMKQRKPPQLKFISSKYKKKNSGSLIHILAPDRPASELAINYPKPQTSYIKKLGAHRKLKIQKAHLHDKSSREHFYRCSREIKRVHSYRLGPSFDRLNCVARDAANKRESLAG